MGLRALVVDDERLARQELKRLLAAHPEVEVVGEAADVEEAEAQVAALEPDLLFLDVEMPGGTGFQLLERLERVPRVIFTTAYDAHALKAFEVNALDYLLKPIVPARLTEALERARPRPLPPAVGTPARYLDQVFVRDGERCWFVKLSTVPLLESEGNYTRLHLPGRQPLLGRSLSYLEERLDPDVFFRASRRHLLNLQAIAGLEPGAEGRLVAKLTTGQEVELSRRQTQRFKEKLSP